MKTQSQANKELLAQGLKKCSKCKEIKGVEDFYLSKQKKDGYDYWCKLCKLKNNRIHNSIPEIAKLKREYRRKHHLKNRDKDLHSCRVNAIKRKYNITHEEYLSILKSQNNKCHICGDPITPGRNCHLDHDHNTGKIRGFLCQRCNKGLGHFQDNSELLLSAYNYLTKGTRQ